jgi:hypothetical protein
MPDGENNTTLQLFEHYFRRTAMSNCSVEFIDEKVADQAHAFGSDKAEAVRTGGVLFETPTPGGGGGRA